MNNNKQRVEKEVTNWSNALIKKGMVIPEANKKSTATICCWLLAVGYYLFTKKLH